MVCRHCIDSSRLTVLWIPKIPQGRSVQKHSLQSLSSVVLWSLSGILVTSDEPVTIHVATVRSSGYDASTPDACIARPVSDSSVEHFLVGYDDMSGSRPM